MLSALSDCGGMAAERWLPSDQIPAIIRAELNADVDRDVLTRMRYLARKKRMRQPGITDEQMADYLALAENSPNFAQWLKVRRGQVEPPVRAAWTMATLAIVGVLTVMLIMAIAIAV